MRLNSFVTLRGTSSITTVSSTTGYGSIVLSASSIGEYDVTVSFNNNVGAGLCSVYLNGTNITNTIAAGPSDPLNLTSGTNSFYITLPHSGTSYAVDIVTNNGYRGSVSFTSAVYIPGAPSITSVTPSQNSIAIAWSSVPNATSYNVYLNNTLVTSSNFSPSGSGLAGTITGLSPDTTYSIGVQAVAPDVI